jgi:outer membrane protein
LHSLSAQTDNESGKSFGFAKGDILVEGNLGLGYTNDRNTETTTNSLSFSPQVGFFVSDKVVIGAQLGLGSSQREVNGVEVAKGSSLGLGVFGRYYFLSWDKDLKLMLMQVLILEVQNQDWVMLRLLLTVRLLVRDLGLTIL